MADFFKKIVMETYASKTYGRKFTDNIDEAIWVYIPDEETASQLSEWAKENYYTAFVCCEPGHYYWDEEDETFYKEV